ncbi:glycosyltransferase family 4 protein [Vibrio sp. RC27]
MNILHLASGELTGGAARGAYWLHKGLLNKNINSKLMITGCSPDNDHRVIGLSDTKLGNIQRLVRYKLDSLILKLYKDRASTIFSCGLVGVDFTKSEEYKQADIIHLHWVNLGMLDVKVLKKINKPIVWTLRDMWPFTGGCHYSIDCDRYKIGCGLCPQLSSTKVNDLSYFIFGRKSKFFPKNMTVVGISNWITSEARNSLLLKNSKCISIFNGIDTESFSAINKLIARNTLDIKTNKKIVLVGSTNIKDFYKGFAKFLESLNYLNKENIMLFFFGKFNESLIEEYGFEYRSFGYLDDNYSLNLLYSSSDVFVAPSIQEAFGKTLAEAQCSGTPVVCFDATGPKDIVEHKITGYKAIPFNSKDLAHGINWILDNKNYEELCCNARNKVIREFDSNIVSEKYIKLYRSIIN